MINTSKIENSTVLTNNDKKILKHLCFLETRYTSKDSRENGFFQSRSKIQDDLHLSLPTIRKSLSKLEELNLLEMEIGNNIKGTSTRFYLNKEEIETYVDYEPTVIERIEELEKNNEELKKQNYILEKRVSDLTSILLDTLEKLGLNE